MSIYNDIMEYIYNFDIQFAFCPKVLKIEGFKAIESSIPPSKSFVISNLVIVDKAHLSADLRQYSGNTQGGIQTIMQVNQSHVGYVLNCAQTLLDPINVS